MTTPDIETTELSITPNGVEADKPVTVITDHPDLVDPAGPALVQHLLPPGWTIDTVDTTPWQRDQERPIRNSGTTGVDSAKDLVTAVDQRRTETVPVLYAQERDLTMIAVLNDAHGDETGHGDYKVVAQLRRSPEWQAWLDGQGLHDQVEFAEFIEDHLTDIVSPPAADMLELAQTFHAHTAARFSTTQRLASGRVALNYEEDQQVTAGGDRVIEIPAEFTIAVRPFYGTDRVNVTARLRYRVGRGELRLGWQLNRPDEVERVLFSEQVQEAADALDVPAINGTPPRSRW